MHRKKSKSKPEQESETGAGKKAQTQENEERKKPVVQKDAFGLHFTNRRLCVLCGRLYASISIDSMYKNDTAGPIIKYAI